MAKLTGAVPVKIINADGVEEVVEVRTLRIKEIPKYMECFENEAAAVALFTGKSQAEVEELPMQAFEALLAKGEELNLGFLEAFAKRTRERREKLMPGFNKAIEEQIKVATAAVSRLQNG